MTATLTLRSETSGRPELVELAEYFADTFDLASLSEDEIDAQWAVGDDDHDTRLAQMALAAEMSFQAVLAEEGWVYDGPIDGDHGVSPWLDGVCFVVVEGAGE